MAQINWTAESAQWLKDIHDNIAEDNPQTATRRGPGDLRQSSDIAAISRTKAIDTTDVPTDTFVSYSMATIGLPI